QGPWHYLLGSAVDSKSDAPPWRRALGGGKVEAEVGDRPERLRPESRGRHPNLHFRVIGPAALGRRRPGAQPPGQVGIQVSCRKVQSPADASQLLGRDILEPTLELGEKGGRDASGLGDRRQTPVRIFPPTPEECSQAHP